VVQAQLSAGRSPPADHLSIGYDHFCIFLSVMTTFPVSLSRFIPRN
jgi:hypothetical protein